MPEDKYGHYQYYEISRTSYKEHTQDGRSMCDKRTGSTTVKDCIESFIDSDLGCHIPWHTNACQAEDKNCSNREQFQNYVILSNKLSSLVSEDMEQETGCIRYCDRMEYKLWETTPLGMKAKYKPEWFTLSFIFSSGNKDIQRTT